MRSGGRSQPLGEGEGVPTAKTASVKIPPPGTFSLKMFVGATLRCNMEDYILKIRNKQTDLEPET